MTSNPINNMVFPSKQDIDKVVNERTKALKEIFSKEIKGTFLLSVLRKVCSDHPDFLKYYNPILKFDMKSIIQGENDDFDYDICRHIIGIHTFNMLGLDDSMKGAFQRDQKYIAKLCNEVYENIKLRELGSSYFRIKEMFPGDRYLFFPIGYDSFVITTYLHAMMDNNESLKASKYRGFILSIINEVSSALCLIESGLIRQAYPHIRNIIELYFKYEILLKNPNAIDEYYKFCKYQIDFATEQKYNEELKTKYKNHRKECSISEYMNYGWIDSIIEFGYLGDEKKYSIPGLYNYLKMVDKNRTNMFEDLKTIHNACHNLSHGSTISMSSSLNSFFDVMTCLYYVLETLLINTYNETKIEPVVEKINLIEKYNKDWKTFFDKGNKICEQWKEE